MSDSYEQEPPQEDITNDSAQKSEFNSSTSEYKRLPLFALLTCSIAGAFLFNVNDLAINVVFFSALLAVMFWITHKPHKYDIKNLISICIGTILVLSFAWRESSTLLRINVVALIALLLISINRNNNKEKNNFYLVDLIGSFYAVLKKAIISPVSKSQNEIRFIAQHPRIKNYIWGVIRGLAISLPFVILSGAILTSADIRFSNYIDQLFDFNVSIPFFVIPLVTSYFISVAFLTPSEPNKSLAWFDKMNAHVHLPGIEVVTVLSALNAVFTLYIYIQLGYYFGDDAMIKNTTGIAYSQYARTGFFQLLSLSIIVLGFLWCLAWLIRKDKKSIGRWFKIMSIIMICLLTVIEASAIHRMILYTNAYGLTEARFYALALMLWIGLIYIIFTLTILRSKRGKFLANALACGIGIVIALNFINPAGLIAQYNLDQREKIQLDFQYLITLGADAHPAILRNFSALNISSRCNTLKSIRHFTTKNNNDWRIWSWGTYNTQKALLKLKHECTK